MGSRPFTLYLYDSIAYLCAMPAAIGPARHGGIALLSRVACGLRLSLPVGPWRAAPPATPLSTVGRRTAAHSAIVNIHPSHPRFRSLAAFIEKGWASRLDGHDFEPFQERLDAACRAQLNPAEASELIEDVLDMVLRGGPAVVPMDRRVFLAMQLLDRRIDYPFEELAQAIQLSPSRLSHLFSTMLGVSFRSYVLWARTMMAWELATFRPDLSLTEISHRMGFADSAHLSRAFRRFFHFCPTEIRDSKLFLVLGMPAPPGRRIPAPASLRPLLTQSEIDVELTPTIPGVEAPTS